MNKQTLPLALLSVTLFLICGNVVLARWSVRLPFRKKLEEIRTAQDPNLLFLGNSLLDGRVDVAALQSGLGSLGPSTKPLNAALGGTDPPVQSLLMDYALRCHPSVQTLVVGIYDYQLTESTSVVPEDLTGNDAVGLDSRFPVREVSSTYGFNTFQDAELLVLRGIPMLTYRKNAWKYVEILRRDLGEMGMPHAETNRNGRASDFAALEAGTPEVFDEEANESLRHGGAFNQSYTKIFNDASKDKLRVVVVVMPMSPSHWESYYSRPSWSRYLEKEDKLLEAKDIQVIDASHWMPSQTQFVDALHMTPEAATDFSWRLGKRLSGQGD